ncbi:UNVERIFIED_CONTAM: hypothetical protein GTU68_021350, partial [Idotea baltica]|nr:hypothetical protein [Idotea baltica]
MQKNSTNDKLTGFHDLLDYSSVIADGVVLLKSGALVATWVYEGIDSDTKTNNELNYRVTQLNTVLRRFGSGWMTHHNNIRIPSNAYPRKDKMHFPDEVTANIDEERRMLFESQSINFENRMVVTLTFLP